VGARRSQRLKGEWRNLRLIHLPHPASWLNQIEIYFSILQRNALTRKDFHSLDQPAERFIGFQQHRLPAALAADRPTLRLDFTRRDLDALMARLAEREPQLRLAA
jgi:DDE superfamily endonuclease